VRWTEQRNMAAFLDLVAAKKVNLEAMITRLFPIEEAVKAYDLVLGKTGEKCLGILLEYNNSADEASLAKLGSRQHVRNRENVSRGSEMGLGIGFIGAGNFAQDSLLPPLRNYSVAQLIGVATASGVNGKTVAKKFGFRFCTTDPTELLQDPDIHCIFIATRHNLHAQFAVRALQHHKHVFVEKPLALSREELSEVITAYQSSRGELMVGYNRRFSPLMTEAKRFFDSRQSPLLIQYRVNAGYIPRTHWTQDAIEGGGRILGEVCHFVDVMQYLTDAEPRRVYAEAITSDSANIVAADNVNITISFSDGSLGAITYVALGDPGLGKERIEIYGGNATAVIDDFRVAEFYRNRGRVKRLKHKGKGHEEEVKEFVSALRTGSAAPISFNSLILTSLTTFGITESLKAQVPLAVESPVAFTAKTSSESDRSDIAQVPGTLI
jgi:polar amino acid transport system substrate-binding protein